MKRVVLINSYSDRNKGDLGIILGTINIIKSKYPNCKIDAISSFASDDNWFYSEHIELKKYINKIFPNVIGRVHKKSIIGKLYIVIRDIVKSFFIEFFPIWFLDIYLSIFHSQTKKIIKKSNLIISKGGSFLCNRDNFIDKLRLQRELMIFRICLRYNKKIIIWGQSIGPVYGKRDLLRIRNILKKMKLVVVREQLCLSSYNFIFKDLKNIIIGHDLAFNLPNEKILKLNKAILLKDKCNVAFTLKNYNSESNNKKYFEILKNIIDHLNNNYDCTFHFVPHVTIDDDVLQVKRFVSLISKSISKNRIIVDENEYSINNLLEIYKSKDILIGTRLHSTIFALTTNTRVINIGYHGTKAKGVFNNIGLGDCQFDIDDPMNKIIHQINNLLADNFDFSEKLKQIRSENNNIFNLF
tara:strand:- start:1682 stop:2917 length:1236 start_codon:yes stop_codon:yes gene_type:complete